MDEYVVLAHREGNIKDLKGLKQKKVLVQVGGLGEVPTIWLDTLLMKQGLPVSRQFCPELRKCRRHPRPCSRSSSARRMPVSL